MYLGAKRRYINTLPFLSLSVYVAVVLSCGIMLCVVVNCRTLLLAVLDVIIEESFSDIVSQDDAS